MIRWVNKNSAHIAQLYAEFEANVNKTMPDAEMDQWLGKIDAETAKISPITAQDCARLLMIETVFGETRPSDSFMDKMRELAA